VSVDVEVLLMAISIGYSSRRITPGSPAAASISWCGGGGGGGDVATWRRGMWCVRHPCRGVGDGHKHTRVPTYLLVRVKATKKETIPGARDVLRLEPLLLLLFLGVMVVMVMA